ncbi:MAG TPA: MarR family transcriptional regulator [Nocardioides sp.]|uniref:MarR family winged helix-turn-helix transcriptional regulator n=1 Tax=Nocardioides sp. TaxID=35761 RepID=UPI002D80428B|nr:MarR family transcriptional regulator [Nocardioides sp.]HET6651475.1 MarR family transcriptional regulator [Nocardioides sp.]
MQLSVEAVTAAGQLPEPATLEDALMVASARVGRRFRQRLPGDDLDFSSLILLKTVAHLGPMRVSTLAAELDLDASTVSRHVKSLEDRDLLERTSDPDDGRASQVGVSAHGTASIEASATRRRELIGSLLADWSDADRESLRRLLHQLSLSLESKVHPA